MAADGPMLASRCDRRRNAEARRDLEQRYVAREDELANTSRSLTEAQTTLEESFRAPPSARKGGGFGGFGGFSRGATPAPESPGLASLASPSLRGGKFAAVPAAELQQKTLTQALQQPELPHSGMKLEQARRILLSFPGGRRPSRPQNF